MSADAYTEPVRVFDPSSDPPMTVRCHPAARPDSPEAVLAIRLGGNTHPLPWVVVTGPEAAWPLADDEVAGWSIAHPAAWSPQLRRDLARLRELNRKDTA